MRRLVTLLVLLLTAAPVVASKSPSPPERWAIIVARKSNKNQTAAEAEALIKVLNTRYGFKNSRVTTLYDDNATQSAFAKAMKHVGKETKSGDQLVLVLDVPRQTYAEVTILETQQIVPTQDIWSRLTISDVSEAIASLSSLRILLVIPGCEAEIASSFSPFRYQKGPSIASISAVDVISVCGAGRSIDDPYFPQAIRLLREALGTATETVTTASIARTLHVKGLEISTLRLPDYSRPEFELTPPPTDVRADFERLSSLDPATAERTIDAVANSVTSGAPFADPDDVVRTLSQYVKHDAPAPLALKSIRTIGAFHTTDATASLASIYANTNNSDYRKAAIEALSQFTDTPVAFDTIQSALADPSPAVRIASVQALTPPDLKSIPALLKIAASDPDEGTRVAALQSLASCPAAPAPAPVSSMPQVAQCKDLVVAPAIALLKDPSPRIRREAVTTLASANVAAGAQSLAFLITHDPEAAVREAAAYTLATAKLDSVSQAEVARELMLAVAKDPAEPVRVAAVSALGHCPSAETIRRLRDLLRKDRSPAVQAAAAEALGTGKIDVAVPDLVAALQRPDANVRRAAAAALGAIGNAQSIDGLLNALKDTDPYVRKEAATALDAIKVGKGEQMNLIKRTHDPLPVVRAQAVEKLGDSADPDVVPILITTLEDADVSVRSAAIRALGEFHDTPSVSLLREAAASGQPVTTRLGALLTLFISHPKEAREDLEKLAISHDESTEIRASAVRSLAAYGSDVSVAILLAASRDDDAVVRYTAVHALAEVSSPESLARLKEMTEDQSESVRQAAVAAVRKLLAEPRPLTAKD